MIRYIASCSCGKDSVAMVLTLIEKEYPLDCVVFLDTGKEFNAIYKVWDKLTKILDKKGALNMVLNGKKMMELICIRS